MYKSLHFIPYLQLVKKSILAQVPLLFPLFLPFTHGMKYVDGYQPDSQYGQEYM